MVNLVFKKVSMERVRKSECGPQLGEESLAKDLSSQEPSDVGEVGDNSQNSTRIGERPSVSPERAAFDQLLFMVRHKRSEKFDSLYLSEREAWDHMLFRVKQKRKEKFSW